MILTEEEIDELISGEWSPRKVLARAIEQAILDKLQDKLKNSDRYEWLKYYAEAADWEMFGYQEIEQLDKVIDSAMGEE